MDYCGMCGSKPAVKEVDVIKDKKSLCKECALDHQGYFVEETKTDKGTECHITINTDHNKEHIEKFYISEEFKVKSYYCLIMIYFAIMTITVCNKFIGAYIFEALLYTPVVFLYAKYVVSYENLSKSVDKEEMVICFLVSLLVSVGIPTIVFILALMHNSFIWGGR